MQIDAIPSDPNVRDTTIPSFSDMGQVATIVRRPYSVRTITIALEDNFSASRPLVIRLSRSRAMLGNQR